MPEDRSLIRKSRSDSISNGVEWVKGAQASTERAKRPHCGTIKVKWVPGLTGQELGVHHGVWGAGPSAQVQEGGPGGWCMWSRAEQASVTQEGQACLDTFPERWGGGHLKKGKKGGTAFPIGLNGCQKDRSPSGNVGQTAFLIGSNGSGGQG